MEMKSKILHILRNREGYVSGQDLCEKFGVSRTAIWKAIHQLQAEGYEIEAVPNKGYHVVVCPDVVSAEEVKSRLFTKWAGKQVYYFDKVDSTNNKAKRLAEENAEHGTVVLADQQEQGKGRRGKAWSTLPKTAVAMTIIVRPQIRPEKASMLTLVMGLAVARSCRELYGLEAKIKWPNDIVVKGKKLCGILTEMSTEMNLINYIVIGAGINVNMKAFPEEIQNVAASIAIETGKEHNRAELIQYCIQNFEAYYEKFGETEDLSLLQQEYNELLVSYDQEVRIMEPGNEYSGISKGINEKGELMVVDQAGKMTLVYAGEVSVRGIYGYV